MKPLRDPPQSKKRIKQPGLSPGSEKNISSHTDKHGETERAARTFSVASTFMSGVMAITLSQILGAPLKVVDPKTYQAYMAWTKENFAILMTTITEWWAPTVIRVSGDESMRGQLFQMQDGSLKCNFPHRMILMANHQLYTDWLYVWWIAYTNKTHGHVYIVLKESLKRVPIIGWGMQLFNFIFLSRKWEKDEQMFKQHLGRLRNDEPAWLVIFPEGTNLSQVTREKSSEWSKQTGIPDMKHQLLPRTMGLRFCLKEMKTSMNWLYDATIAYEGVAKGSYGQDIFTLKSSFFEGRPPKSVNIFWRRFKISEIPYNDIQAFDRWLINRWREKDYILEYFSKFGSFPAGRPLEALKAVNGKEKPQHAKAIITEVKGKGWEEFLGIFEPITAAASAATIMDTAASEGFGQLIQTSLLSKKLRDLYQSSASIKRGNETSHGKDLQATLKSKVQGEIVINRAPSSIPQKPTSRRQKKHQGHRIQIGKSQHNEFRKIPVSENSQTDLWLPSLLRKIESA